MFSDASQPVIEVRGLSKAYQVFNSPRARLWSLLTKRAPKDEDAFWALKDVSFDVFHGETLGILGVNGSGKSTLLSILAGVLPKTDGDVNIRGDIAALLELGAGFNPEYTGVENVEFTLALAGFSKSQINEKLPVILSFADIGDFVNRPVKIYSSGMFVRLAFATSIMAEPDVFLIDEALAVGDIFFQQKCLLFLKEEMKAATKLLVTHDVGQIANLSDRVIVLHQGELIYTGSPREAVEIYTQVSLGKQSVRKKQEEQPVPQSSVSVDRALSPPAELPEMRDYPYAKLAGAMERAHITQTGIFVDGAAYQGYITQGQRVTCAVRLVVQKAIPNSIIGYLLIDRLGNSVFGNNASVDIALGPGEYMVRIEFVWPLVAKGEYFLTLGIGRGVDAMNHVIECWAQAAQQFSSEPMGEAVHGVFTNKGIELTVWPAAKDGAA